MTAPAAPLRLAYALDADGHPLLMPEGGEGLLAGLSGRREAYVPEWRGNDDSDAGMAVARIWSAQAGAAIERLRLLPDKLVRECLSTAGVSPSPQRAARAMLAFTPDMKKLAGPLPMPSGFQLSSPRADGGKGDVVWETEDDLVLTPLELKEALVFDGESLRTVEVDAPFHPFGERPQIGASLYLGFAAGGEPGAQLSLGIVPVAAGEPVALGGRPSAAQSLAVLRWESLDRERGFRRADLIADGSALFTAGGVVRLSIASGWSSSRPSIAPEGDPLLWLRVRLVSGSFFVVPRLQALFPHAVYASARQTHRNQSAEVERDGAGSFVRLGKANVAPGSVVIEADDPISGQPVLWQEVATLSGQTGGSRVFTLDPATGVLRFGDGREGAMLPEGLRYVTLIAFAVVAGAESAVAPDAIAKPLRRLVGVAGVRNPGAAAGGTSLESDEAAIRRGPATVKARGRAVTAADVAALALEAEGSNIVRAYAVAGVDATLDGVQRPGAIGVFVMSARRATDPADEPPRAGPAELAAVARHISGRVGPVLARVTVGNPGFTRIRVEAALVCRPGVDLGQVSGLAEAALGAFLNPETGSGNWRLGDTIRHSDVTRLILESTSEIESVPYVTLVTDGLRRAACSDTTLPTFNLPWPDRHEILASHAEDDA